MKAVLVPGTVITNKEQAIAYFDRISQYIHSYEEALAIDQITEKLVKAGIIDWSDVE